MRKAIMCWHRQAYVPQGILFEHERCAGRHAHAFMLEGIQCEQQWCASMRGQACCKAIHIFCTNLLQVPSVQGTSQKNVVIRWGALREGLFQSCHAGLK
jgi:hypothetical protein